MEVQLGGGAAGCAPSPSIWEEGTPSCRMKRKNGKNQYHRNKKTNRVIVEIILELVWKNIFTFSILKANVNI